MTALVEVAAFVPQRRVLIESLARQLHLSPMRVNADAFINYQTPAQARRTQRRHERAVEVVAAVPVDGMAVEHCAVVDFTPRLGICPVRAAECE